MRRVATTVVTLVGANAMARTEGLATADNVAELVPDTDTTAAERAMTAWRAAASNHTTFTVHDADPLADVAAAWIARFTAVTDGGDPAPAGRLEVAVADTVARWRAGSIDLPDYYLVLDPESLPETDRHWYLGVLHDAAPNRMVPVADGHDAVLSALASLQPARWWPPVDELLARAERSTPDLGVTPV